MTDAVIWGGKGHAKVIRPILEYHGHRIVAVYDRDPSVTTPFADVPLITTEAEFRSWRRMHSSGELGYALAIGGEHGRERCRLADQIEQFGLNPLPIVHQRAWIADSAKIGQGCHVLALSAVCVEAELGRHTIINTGASVDHECILGQGVHIMPGATLAGCVVVEDFATVGSNATVLPRVRIGAAATVGAGAVVTADVPANARVAGVPARRI